MSALGTHEVRIVVVYDCGGLPMNPGSKVYISTAVV